MNSTALVRPCKVLSESFFAKGRLYGYGPKYLKISTGKVLYREEDVLAWLASREFNPEAVHNV